MLVVFVGYMIVLVGDCIVVGDMLIIGFIGVFFQYLQVKELFDKIGVLLEMIKLLLMKVELLFFNLLSDQIKVMINVMVQDSFYWFVDLVVECCKMMLEQVMVVFDGLIFIGWQVFKNGFIDEFGGMLEIKVYLKICFVDFELLVVDWKLVFEGWVVMLFGVFIYVVEWLGLDKDFLVSILKMLGIQYLFFDGFVFVWQVECG